jgi:GDP-L-fucose synthase
MQTVLVTGARGMVGRHIQGLVEEGNLSTDQRSFVFVGREIDLRDRAAVDNLFNELRPTHVLHCAARLASAKDMTTQPVDFWLDNVEINNNVLRAAHAHGARVVSVLSSVMFAKDTSLITGTNAELYGGELHPVSEAYGFAKRALGRLTAWYRKQHGARFSCVVPTNIFGAYGDFQAGSAPLLNALIRKAHDAKAQGTPCVVMGSGKPKRQMLYARDLAKVLLWALDNFDDDAPLIVAGDEVAVSELALMACAAAGGGVELEFDMSCPDGPLRRTADTSRLRALVPGLHMTPLEEAIQRTYSWYAQQQQASN